MNTPTAEFASASITYRLEVDDAPSMPTKGWSNKGMTFVPDCVTVSISYSGHPSKTVEVTGQLIRKNGTPGQNRGATSFEARGYVGSDLGEMPQWLTAIVQPYLDAPVFTGTAVAR